MRFIQCLSFASFSLELERPCNTDCGCERKFDPVCASDGQTHFSACFAGCQKFVNEVKILECIWFEISLVLHLFLLSS